MAVPGRGWARISDRCASDSITGEMYFRQSARRRSTFRAVRPPRQPYALDIPVFPFAAIAAFAARAPLGGPREIGLAAYVTARMADDVTQDRRLPAGARRARAVSARRWLSTLALAEPVRRIFGELAAATESGALETALALRRVIDVTSTSLDAPSRADLERLASELESQPIART